ncbi:MAG: TolC family protein [Desulfobacterales bacterium]|nr:TolC family protein [Desulfobacterales bacterium]
MMVTRCCHCLSGFLIVCLLLLASAPCALAEEQVDRTAGGPTVSADTTLQMYLASTGQPEEIAVQTVPPDSLKVTITEAILLCLENNRSLLVERLNPSIQQTFEDEERSIFDPEINVDISVGRMKGERLARSGSETEDFIIDSTEGIISLEQYFPTGTTVALEARTLRNDSSLYEDGFYSNRLGMTITQALLKGFGTDANLVRLKQARLDTRMSEYELRGFTEFLVSEVESTCWDYALARRQIEIVEESLKVSRQQLDETNELIAVGRLAKVELAAVQAEVASQEQALIEVRANKESIRLQLLRFLNPAGPGTWQREVDLIHQPTLPEIKLEDVELYVDVAMRMNPILNEARLEILHGDMELVKTRNGLLPLMDVFITLGESGYANSFGESISNINKDSYDALAGIRLNYPIFNREAKALNKRAEITWEQAQKAFENLSQLVEVDIRIAYIEVDRTKKQIAASSVTRMFNEEKFRIETEKLRVGKSTSFLVAQAQRDLLGSRIAEVRALTNYLKALIDLYRLDGSLLERRGISAPGSDPVKLSKS